jgi:hypothetical protein
MIWYNVGDCEIYLIEDLCGMKLFPTLCTIFCLTNSATLLGYYYTRQAAQNVVEACSRR